jgi:hypothetical protein
MKERRSRNDFLNIYFLVEKKLSVAIQLFGRLTLKLERGRRVSEISKT